MIFYMSLNKIRILHFPPLKITLRSHLTFYDNEYFENYYLIPDDSKNRSLVKSKNIKIFKHLNKSKKDYSEIEKIILKIKPDVFIISDILTDIQFKEFLKKHVNLLYFVHHGFWNCHAIKDLVKNDMYKKNYDYLTRAFVLRRNFHHFNKFRNKFYPINGLPQLDYMLTVDLVQAKKSLHKINKSSILLITNYKTEMDTCVKEYTEILNSLIKFSIEKNYHIYTKIKRPDSKISSMIAKNVLNKNKYVTLISDDSLLYEYFFCDIIVIQTTGTSLIESLILNKPTILCQIKNHIDYMDIKKYKHIPQANDLNQLTKWLKKLDKKSQAIISSEKYMNDRNAYLEENLGKLENTTNKILEIIQNDFDQIDKNKI